MSTLVFRAVPLLCLCSTLCGTPLWELPSEPGEKIHGIINCNTSFVTSKGGSHSIKHFLHQCQWLVTISAVEDNWNNLTQAQEVIPKAGFYVCFEHQQQCWNICDPLEVNYFEKDYAYLNKHIIMSLLKQPITVLTSRPGVLVPWCPS